jgi:hypothetical protein
VRGFVDGGLHERHATDAVAEGPEPDRFRPAYVECRTMDGALPTVERLEQVLEHAIAPAFALSAVASLVMLLFARIEKLLDRLRKLVADPPRGRRPGPSATPLASSGGSRCSTARSSRRSARA